MFMWQAEMLQAAFSSGTQFSQSDQVREFQDFSSMVDILDIQGEHISIWHANGAVSAATSSNTAETAVKPCLRLQVSMSTWEIRW